jgi:hypothetical protein
MNMNEHYYEHEYVRNNTRKPCRIIKFDYILFTKFNQIPTLNTLFFYKIKLHNILQIFIYIPHYFLTNFYA